MTPEAARDRLGIPLLKDEVKPPAEPFPPNTLFRVRRTWFGRCILQKFDGDILKGPPPGFRDVPWEPNMGGFTIVRREALAKLVERVAAADARARQQREQRKAKKDFEASRLENDGGGGS